MSYFAPGSRKKSFLRLPALHVFLHENSVIDILINNLNMSKGSLVIFEIF